MDDSIIEEKTKEFIESFRVGNESADIELEKLIDYLQTYSDQRKKPSETHGLDKWANEKLGFEKDKFSVEERKLLRKNFYFAENDVLEKAKYLIELMFDENKKRIKSMLSRPLKDELKIHICQMIAEKRLTGFEENIINLFLKGTQKASTAAFECMRTLKDISFYFPLKRHKPSRHQIKNEDIEAALNELKQDHLEVKLVEEGFHSEYFHKIDTPFDVLKLCAVLIGLNYSDQKSIFKKFKTHFPNHFSQIGIQLGKNYSAIKQIKSQDYLSSLKKALGDSLMIGGWEVQKKTELLLSRNLASQKDFVHIAKIFNNLGNGYRHHYLKSILNPPKHVKGDFNKKRLFWVYDQLKGKFKSDFKNFEKFVRWHTGNDDSDIKIETMLLLAALSNQPKNEVIQSLRKFSEDDRYQNYHDRINSTLPNDSLLLNLNELAQLSDTALESKLSTIIDNRSPSIVKATTETLCEYLKVKAIDGARFQLVYKQIINLIQSKTNENDNSVQVYCYKTLVKILKSDESKDTSLKRNFILTDDYFLQQFCYYFPDFTDQLPLKMLRNIIENCILDQANALKSINLALQLTLKDRKHQILIWTEWVKQLVSEKNNLTQVLVLLNQNEKKDVFSNILTQISFLKKELYRSEEQLDKEKQKMQRIIANEILPKLKKAKRRAGDQPLLTESYDMIFNILSGYTQKESDKTDEKKAESITDTAPLDEFADYRTSLVEVINETSSLPLVQRNKIMRKLIAGRANNNQFEKLLQEINDIPHNRLEWFVYRLIEYVSDELNNTDSLIQHFKDEEKILWNIANKMLYRLFNEHQKALTQIKMARDNKLKEIGRAISEFLERIEINLFGYYELSENLADLGLLRIFNKPGEIVTKENLDVKKHKVLPTKKEANKYQVITLGLQLPTGETVREAYLESKEN